MITSLSAVGAFAQTWTADNGDGTFTNPLFYDEFSDPDLIRVGDDFYLTGTTMHTMPGLPILHSKDLVNWKFLTYVFDKLDLGPEYRLEEGKAIYGQGIWAPCFRYHNGTYYIFSNVNRQKTQLFTAKNPAGPWTHLQMNKSFHDLSVLFDDDGKAYIIWGYQDVRFAQLTDDLLDVVPDTERTIINKHNDNATGMGEGVHFYKFNGKYYIFSAWFAGRMRMPCARADKPEGPYEINPEISADEDFGLAEGYRLRNTRPGEPLAAIPPNLKHNGRMSMHQGGIVDTQTGEWWGFSMMDYNSVGRLVCLSPVTWKEGWPYYGLPGNLKRSPRTWTKPNTGHNEKPSAPYERSDDFSADKLKPIWQWNHVPEDGKWSLKNRPGFLRLNSLPAKDFWTARNTLTQRSIGPMSIPTVELDVSGLKDGDVAGLALLNYPYAWIGVQREAGKLSIAQFEQTTGKTATAEFSGTKIWLRASCDYLKEKATFSFSTDGKTFQPIGDEFTLIFQLRTFQGVRYALFNYNTSGSPGGFADFDSIVVDEPHPRGLMTPIPVDRFVIISSLLDGYLLGVRDGKVVALPGNDASVAFAERTFKVVHRGHGRVALQIGGSSLSVDESGNLSLKSGEPGDAEAFLWTETPYGDLVLLSIKSQRLLNINPKTHAVTATSPGPRPDREDGTWLGWKIVNPR